MCGIAGFAGFRDDMLLGRMCRAIEHRGPDDDGFHIEEKASLGMRRLSIIDLETGKQPISNEDGSIVIVYNGEIYNYPRLRHDLSSRGHTLKTATDTECIVHLYEEKGDACVEDLNGMFAFALWDRKRQRLLVARDRLGIKPVSYLPLADGVIFGSEIKSILQYSGYRPEVDPVALHHYLTWMYVPGPHSVFKGIRKLPPGHALSWDANQGLKTWQYWDVPQPRDTKESEWDIIDHVDQVLQESVARQMISDVPVGAYLSGGLDSSLVAVLMQKASAEPVRTFSIGYGERAKLYDELPYARLVARKFNTDHHELIATPKVVDILEKVAWHCDEPYANSSAIPAYLISKEARHTVKVMLSGAGGDELFAGYPRNIAARWLGMYSRVPRFLRRGVASLVNLFPESTEGRHLVRRAREFANGAVSPGPGSFLKWVAFYDEAAKRELYTHGMRQLVDGADSFADFGAFLGPSRQGGHLDRMLYLDMKTWLPYNILEYSDKMSMMASLEARVPLLDNELVDLAATIPQRLKVRGITGKYILKKVAERHLPREIIYRKKKGFMVPIGIWLREDLKEMVNDLLSERAIRERGYFEPARVQGVLKAHFAGQRDYSHHIWMLLMLEMWHRAFLPQASRIDESAAGREILSARQRGN